MATDTRPVDVALPTLYQAIIRSPIAPMHGEPRVASPMISQALAGHRVDVVDEEADWSRVRGQDRYEGWVHHGFLMRIQEPVARDSLSMARVSLGCETVALNGIRRQLPLRAVLALDEEVTNGEAVDPLELAERFPRTADAITRSARELFMATSYLWGGVTPWGADCSGLVQSVFALHGVQLPRDAWQQAETGVDAGRDVGDLEPADLLFFSDREDKRITHVGIALGKRRMVHLALARGGYAIERLSDRRDPFVDRLRERFLFARRVL